ncbi:MAG: relaxase/mobilization nuclease domain-containing protein [Candidatus Pseudoscilispira sp.]|nr:relaxase/mobilization nuclease domain-containing protein [Candidatus Pseudoscilispira sp.]
MAITKIIAIRDRLDKRVNYVVNSEKTSLDASVLYAINPEKTEQAFFTAVLNCESVQTAYTEMTDTKKRWNKTDGVLGYHFIQSFAPGEVTPEQAHEIGMEFARRMFGERYEVVVGTHLDKAHLHNHIVINSVSFVDGQKYHSSPKSYYNEVRGTSDELCRENDLSVITPQGKGKHYGEWKAEQNGKPTVRSIIREDIDRIIGEAYTYQTFLLLLQRNGYAIKSGPNRKYTAVRSPGAKRFIRLDSLGDGYTEEAIKQRLMGQRSGAPQKPKQPVYHAKRYRVKGKLSRYPKRKITGFLALYFRYVYLLRGARRAKPSYRAAFPIRKEVIRLERYQKQFQYLIAQNITTPAQLAEQISNLETEIAKLTEERNPLYGERRAAPDEEAKAQCTAEIDRHTASLREKRRELALCRRIQADIPQVREQVQEAQTNQKNELRKEEQQYEYQRRNR